MSAATARPFRRTHRRSQSSVDLLQTCGITPEALPSSLAPPTCPRTPPNDPAPLVVIRTANTPAFQLEEPFALPVYKPVQCRAYAATLEARNRSPSPPRRMLGYQPASIGASRRFTL